MLHVSIYKIHNMIPFLCTKVKFHIKYFLEPGFITLSLHKGTHDLYFELMKVLGISLSCLLQDGGSVNGVSCLNINRNSHSNIYN